jgi:hypothetical protein
MRGAGQRRQPWPAQRAAPYSWRARPRLVTLCSLQRTSSGKPDSDAFAAAAAEGALRSVLIVPSLGHRGSAEHRTPLTEATGRGTRASRRFVAWQAFAPRLRSAMGAAAMPETRDATVRSRFSIAVSRESARPSSRLQRGHQHRAS